MITTKEERPNLDHEKRVLLVHTVIVCVCSFLLCMCVCARARACVRRNDCSLHCFPLISISLLQPHSFISFHAFFSCYRSHSPHSELPASRAMLCSAMLYRIPFSISIFIFISFRLICCCFLKLHKSCKWKHHKNEENK